MSAVLRTADLAGQPGMVLRKGDADSGGVLVVLRGRAGLMVLVQTRTAKGEPAWMRGTGPDPVNQAAADAYIRRQSDFDPDLWVIEFESPGLSPPFDATLV